MQKGKRRGRDAAGRRAKRALPPAGQAAWETGGQRRRCEGTRSDPGFPTPGAFELGPEHGGEVPRWSPGCPPARRRPRRRRCPFKTCSPPVPGRGSDLWALTAPLITSSAPAPPPPRHWPAGRYAALPLAGCFP